MYIYIGEAAGLPHGGGLFGAAAATMGMLGTAVRPARKLQYPYCDATDILRCNTR